MEFNNKKKNWLLNQQILWKRLSTARVHSDLPRDVYNWMTTRGGGRCVLHNTMFTKIH